MRAGASIFSLLRHIAPRPWMHGRIDQNLGNGIPPRMRISRSRHPARVRKSRPAPSWRVLALLDLLGLLPMDFYGAAALNFIWKQTNSHLWFRELSHCGIMPFPVAQKYCGWG